MSEPTERRIVVNHDKYEPYVECPFNDREFDACRVGGPACPDRYDDPDSDLYLYRIPESCPLRTGPITVAGDTSL